MVPEEITSELNALRDDRDKLVGFKETFDSFGTLDASEFEDAKKAAENVIKQLNHAYHEFGK